MSLNNLNLNSVFPSNLNGLSVITTSNGGGLPVTANVPLIETTTATEQNIKLYESSTDLINFATYGKSLVLNNIYGTGAYFSSGAFNTLSATGATIANLTTTNFTGTNVTTTNLTTTNFTGTNVRTTNLTTTNMTGTNGVITNLSSTNFTGTNAYLTNATIGNLTIAGATIPYLNYTTATGTTNYTTNTSATYIYNNVYPTNPMLGSINYNTTLSCYPNASARINFRPKGFADSTNEAYIDNAGTFFSQNVNTYGVTCNNVGATSTISAGGVLSTTSGKIQNGNSTWTTNSNDYFINANNDTIYLRPKGTTATPADAQVYLSTNGNLVCSTGTLTAWNGYFNNALNAPNADVSVYAITASQNVKAPTFTGTNYYGTTYNGTTYNGGTFKGNVSVTNPQKMYFYQLDGTTECLRIEPAFGTPALSWYNATYGSQLQFFMSCSSSGGAFTCNQANATDYTYSPNALHDNFYTTRRDGIQSNSMYFYNNTSFQSRPFIFQNLNQSAYIQAYGNNNRNNGFAIRDSAERWFIYNKANTSQLAFNNNSLDQMTMDSSGVQVKNTLQVGPDNSQFALINLGTTGTLNGTLNSRQGYIYMDGTNLVLNNQQYNNARLQSSTIGSVYISPANGVYPTIWRPNGQMQVYNDSYADALCAMTNYSTGGYGLYINKPNDGVNGNNYYALVIQGNGYSSAITMHPQVSGLVSNITLGRTNYPFSNDALTIRPYSLSSQDIWINISNDYAERNGKVFIGQNGTGGFRGSDAFIQNWSNNSNGKLSGIYFQTDTTNYGVTAPAQYIDFTGQTFFNPFTLRSGSNTQAGSAFSILYGFKSLPQVGTLYTTSKGAGNYQTWVKANADYYASYTVAMGITKVISSDRTSVNASPIQTPAGARQYSFRADWTGVYDIRWNFNLFASSATQYFIYVYVAGVSQSTTIGYINAGTFSYCNGTKLITVTTGQDVDIRIQCDTQPITMGNNSTWDAIYVG